MENLEQWNHFVKKHGVRILLGVFLILGVMGVLLFEHGGRYPSKFFEHVFMAFSVAAIIGLTIDLTLQQQIATNVFEAAIGYLLPEELRSELRWIYVLPFMCVQHVQTVKIERIEGTSLVRCRSIVVRRFRNFTDKEHSFGVGIGTDEWFHPGHPSRIVNVSYQLDDGPDSGNLSEGRVEKTDDGIRTKTIEVPLGSGRYITTSVEFEEVKLENDWTFIVFGSPTQNPTVMIDAPADLVARVTFDHRTKNEFLRIGDNTWKLSGTLLPHQTIRIRWYRKDQSQQWLKQA